MYKCVARLSTHSGTLCIYSIGALSVVLEKFIPTADHHLGIERLNASIVQDTGPPAVPSPHSGLYEGFTAPQWAAYAKHKQHIASTVCRKHGELKAQMARLTQRDPLAESDPWQRCASKLQYCAEVANEDSKSAFFHVDAWSSWVPVHASPSPPGALVPADITR